MNVGQVLFLYVYGPRPAKLRSINSQKKRGQYPAILTVQAWSIKDLLYGFRGKFSCGTRRIVPSGQDGSILPAWVAIYSARFSSSWLTHGATMGDKSVETLCHFRVLKANFFSNLYNTTPSPLLNVEFPVSRICLFLVQH